MHLIKRAAAWLFLMPSRYLDSIAAGRVDRQQLVAAGRCTACLRQQAEPGYSTREDCHAMGVE